MKKFLFGLLLLPCITQAQLGGNNVVKLNLSSLAFNNYNLTYERSIGKHFSASLGLRYMPKGNLPFQSTVENIIGSENDINYGAFQAGNFAITPEFRWYVHKKMRGFYVAPYLRYASFDMTIPVQYTATQFGVTQTEDANFNGKINSFSGGLMIGVQYPIFKKLVLDIWIVGGHYGHATGNNLQANFNPALNAQEQQSLQQSINDIDISPFKVTGKVTSSTTATLDGSGPWAGVRGLGINLGFKF